MKHKLEIFFISVGAVLLSAGTLAIKISIFGNPHFNIRDYSQVPHSVQFVTWLMIIVLSFVIVFIAYNFLRYARTKRRERKFLRAQKIKMCKHVFKFHDPKSMEHDPFCTKCKKTLTEINF